MYKTEDAYPDGYPIENVELACGFNAEDWVGQISPRPLLLIHGEKDTMVRHGGGLKALSGPCAGEPKDTARPFPDINHAEVYEPRNPGGVRRGDRPAAGVLSMAHLA